MPNLVAGDVKVPDEWAPAIALARGPPQLDPRDANMRGEKVIVHLGLPVVVAEGERHLVDVEELEDVSWLRASPASPGVPPAGDGERSPVLGVSVGQADGLDVVRQSHVTRQSYHGHVKLGQAQLGVEVSLGLLF